MDDFFSVYIYLSLVFVMTLILIAVTNLFPSNKATKIKFLPYESGIQTETKLLQKRFPLHHYLIALIFLVFDIEVLFLYPWAAVGKEIGGSFAFYEMIFFIVLLLIGFLYVWKKGGLEWEQLHKKRHRF